MVISLILLKFPIWGVSGMRVGLTGGIASGKSTISAMLAKMGIHIVDADRIAREVVLPGTPVLEQIRDVFGEQVMMENGTLNRKALGELVFASPDKRKLLEQMIHPAIRAEMRRQMEEWEQSDPGAIIIADIPLLFESGLENWFDDIILVYVPRALQIKRLMDRDQISQAQAEQRLAAQLDIEEKKRKAGFIIDNSGTVEESNKQLVAFLQMKGRM